MWKPIKIKCLFIKPASSGKSLKCTVSDIDEMCNSIKEVLTKRPTWKKGHSDKEREFYITLKGAVGEIWDDHKPQKEEKGFEDDF